MILLPLLFSSLRASVVILTPMDAASRRAPAPSIMQGTIGQEQFVQYVLNIA